MTAQVTKVGAFDMQVCVHAGLSDEDARTFAERENPCGTTRGWSIRRQGDTGLAGAYQRLPCAERAGYVHITLDG
jgi:hypothetical protein